MTTIDLGSLSAKVLVLSDLHLGDPRVDDLVLLRHINAALKQEQPGVLVLAGDILEGKLTKTETTAQLKAICRQVPKTVVLMGNHDSTPTVQFAKELPAELGDAVIGLTTNAPFAIEHGHRFDSWWKRVPCLGKLVIWLQHAIYQVLGWDIQGWLRQFKCVQKKLLKQHVKARDAWMSKVLVVSGHTHLPQTEASGLGYFNSGDWVEHKTYVVFDKGKAKLVELIL